MRQLIINILCEIIDFLNNLADRLVIPTPKPLNERLSDAAYAGNIKEVYQLLNKGASASTLKDYDLICIENEVSKEMASVLKTAGAGAHVHANNNEALHWASGNGHKDVVELLKQQLPEYRAETYKKGDK